MSCFCLVYEVLQNHFKKNPTIQLNSHSPWLHSCNIITPLLLSLNLNAVNAHFPVFIFKVVLDDSVVVFFLQAFKMQNHNQGKIYIAQVSRLPMQPHSRSLHFWNNIYSTIYYISTHTIIFKRKALQLCNQNDAWRSDLKMKKMKNKKFSFIFLVAAIHSVEYEYILITILSAFNILFIISYKSINVKHFLGDLFSFLT